MTTRALIAATMSLLIASVPPAAAETIGDRDIGQSLAQTWCSNCHVVAGGQTNGASTGAPSFRAVASDKAMTPTAISAFLQTPHHRMPDLHLTRQEINDVTAYIYSLRSQPRR
jgi:mono/diheme cytochrome c family protein